jgi:hypothetical protein
VLTPKTGDGGNIVGEDRGRSAKGAAGLSGSKYGEIRVFATLFGSTRFTKLIAGQQFWRFQRKKSRQKTAAELYTGREGCRAVCDAASAQKRRFVQCTPSVQLSEQLEGTRNGHCAKVIQGC